MNFILFHLFYSFFAFSQVQYPLGCGIYEIFAKGQIIQNKNQSTLKIVTAENTLSSTKLNLVSEKNLPTHKIHSYLKLKASLTHFIHPYALEGKFELLDSYPTPLIKNIQPYMVKLEDSPCLF